MDLTDDLKILQITHIERRNILRLSYRDINKIRSLEMLIRFPAALPYVCEYILIL
mgnify:CR=1